MVPERIEREILIEAPLEVVWEVVTDPEHVGGWFGDSAEIDLRPGGEAVLTWEKHGSALAVVETVEPPYPSPSAGPVPSAPHLARATRPSSSSVSARRARARGCVSSRAASRRSKGRRTRRLRTPTGTREGWKHELGELQEYVAKLVRASAQR